MDFNQLFESAQVDAKKETCLYHYTNINALKCILSNKSIKLSRIDKVNDLMEQKRFDSFYENKSYVACFTSRMHESYFFWKAYSNRSEDSIGNSRG